MLDQDPVIKKRLEIIKRNETIVSEYEELKKRGVRSNNIWEILSDKYFTSISNIKKIIYKLNGS